jgi:hypothetical protein
MKFNLGFLSFLKDKKNIAILMLLLSIFISLWLSQLSYVQSLKSMREGYISPADVKMYESILTIMGDKDASAHQKLSTVRSMVSMMTKTDQEDYLKILDNTKLTDDEKVIEIKKFKPFGLEDSMEKTRSSSSS